jgi:NADPH:quinone reductase-like Zn-dependent oxidoreductase
MVATQLGKKMGAKVISVSKKKNGLEILEPTM